MNVTRMLSGPVYCGLTACLISTSALAEPTYRDWRWQQGNAPGSVVGQDSLIRFGDGKLSQGELSQTVDTTRMQYSFASGEKVWHLSGAQAGAFQDLGAGVSIGRATFLVGGGQGSENAWRNSSMYGFDGTYKSGFTPAAYSYTEAALAYQFSPNFGLQAGNIDIGLDGRANPTAQYAAFFYKRLSGNYLSAQRNGTTLATGLDLNYTTSAFRVSYREYENFNEFKLRSVQIGYRKSKTGLFSMSLQSGQSLFNGVSDDRLMFSFRTNWNGNGKLAYNAAPAKQDPEVDPKGSGDRWKWGLIGGLGAAAIVSATGSSSGNGDGGSGGFTGQHEAGFNALNAVNPISVIQNREYGGWVYRSPDGTFASTPPVAGDTASVNIGNPLTVVPGGTVATASYHTHGGPDPRFDNENPSPTDVLFGVLQKVDGYLGTPSGAFKFTNHINGQTVTLGTIAN